MNCADTLAWQEVVYSPENKAIPLQRWGHRLLKTSPTQLLLFGGFGGENAEGAYLDDLWEFNLSSYQWRQLKAEGDGPGQRSNYSIHYNNQDHQVILFAGGASNKLRFNSICLLDLNTMAWKTIAPNTSQAAPWERTYHSAEFSYPYLVVYGGEGVSNLDLDDCWAYHVRENTWRRLQFEGEVSPGRRRFHSSALIGSQFYVVGGCRDNYELIGSIYKADLKALFEEGRTDGFSWEKMMENKILERWGHSSSLYNNKLYIFAGRISSTTDTNDILIFDPTSRSLSKMKVKGRNTPQPRRRHASLMVGRSLLCFGGYNGKYLNDFSFITLPNEHHYAFKTTVLLCETIEEHRRKVESHQRKVQVNWHFEVTHKKGSISLGTNKSLLLRNQFFKLTYSFSQEDKLSISLPDFCTLEMFKCLHLIIMKEEALFCKQLSPLYYTHLIAAMEYFNCSHLIPPVQCHLISLLSLSNCQDMLHSAVELGLQQLKQKAAQIYLKDISIKLDKPSVETEATTSDNFANKLLESNELLHNHPSLSSLSRTLAQIEQLLRFQIDQEQLRLKSPNFFSRTAKQIKSIFAPSQPREQKQSIERQESQQKEKEGCLSWMLRMIGRLNLLRWRNHSEQSA